MTSSDRRPFRFPSPEDWNDLVCDLGLDNNQAHELRILLQHVEGDVQAFADRSPTRDERRELVDALKAFSKALGKLEMVVHDHLPELSEALPHAATAAIGDMLTVTEIERALDKPLAVDGIEHMSGRDFEAGTAFARQAQGVAAGPELLGQMLRRIHQPVEDWLEENRSNKGGRPRDQIRLYLVSKLAEKSEALIGKPPTSNGTFMKLCREVVGQCGLETVGLRDAVERALGVRVS